MTGSPLVTRVVSYGEAAIAIAFGGRVALIRNRNLTATTVLHRIALKKGEGQEDVDARRRPRALCGAQARHGWLLDPPVPPFAQPLKECPTCVSRSRT